MVTEVQKITGIEQVDQFLTDLPTKLWEPCEPNLFSKPRAIGFTAEGGMDLLVPEVIGCETEEAMDAAANLFIAYAKTKNPVALAMVSEGFQWHEEPGGQRKFVDPANDKRRLRVDCDRYAHDADYRAEIHAGGRRECLMVMLETAERQWLITWPIHRGKREGRWLGPMNVNDGGKIERHAGRFSNRRKQHAGDEMVATCPNFRGRGVNPQPIEELRARFPAALLPVPDLEQWMQTAEPVYPERLFDFQNDLSLFVIGIMRYEGSEPQIAVIAFNRAAPMPMSEFRAKAMASLAELRGHPIEENEVRGKLTHFSLGAVAFRLDWGDGANWR